jgi:hypothetical protein
MDIEPALFRIPDNAIATVSPAHDGVQIRVGFLNGYGASVVCHGFSYGHEDGLWELAVMHDGELCYNTPITSDVIGHLETDEVEKLLKRISELPTDDSPLKRVDPLALPE